MNTLDTIKSHDIPTVNDLMLIARTSAGFLDTAAKKVSNPGLKTLLNEMAITRSQFVDGAQTQLPVSNGITSPAGKGVKERTTATATPDRSVQEWSSFYSEMQPRIEDTSMAFVDNVQASETRLLRAFDKLAVDSNVPVGLKQAVAGYLPIMRKQHSLVSSRAWARAA